MCSKQFLFEREPRGYDSQSPGFPEGGREVEMFGENVGINRQIT